MPAGKPVAGITWSDDYSDSRLVIENKSDSTYTEINAIIRTDLLIAKAGSMNPNSHCQAAAALPFQLTGGYVAALGSDKRTVEHAVPMFTPEQAEHVRASQFRLRCDRILPGEVLEVVVATVPSLAAGAFSGRIPPAWISAEVEYDAFWRTRSALPLRQCLTEKCGVIPAVEK